MITPRYVAKRVGRDYVLVRVDTSEVMQRVGIATGGLLVLGWGASHRGLTGALATVAGAALAYYGWTGHNPLDLIRKSDAPQGNPNDAPSYRHHGERSGQMPEDKVDEAAMESFPASDPPASHRTSVASVDDSTVSAASENGKREEV